MAVESAADRQVFVSTDDFGETVTVTATAATFPGVFDREFVAVQDGEVAVESDAPMLTATAEDIATNSVVVGTGLTIQGSAYTVVSAQPNGTGMVTLVLRDG